MDFVMRARVTTLILYFVKVKLTPCQFRKTSEVFRISRLFQQPGAIFQDVAFGTKTCIPALPKFHQPEIF
jgi:hypothetical protein